MTIFDSRDRRGLTQESNGNLKSEHTSALWGRPPSGIREFENGAGRICPHRRSIRTIVVVQSIPFGFDHDRTISACVRSVLNLDIPAIPSAPRGFGRRGVFRFAIAPLNTMCIQRRLDFGGL
ncbi:MAG: hypothetical protein QOI53_3119, partial [Verrucomicrobiota bacterium]|nr:hypothetical protein [Verrucomicrobiota bacterium]